MERAGLALLWIVVTFGGAVLLTNLFGAGVGIAWLVTAVIAAVWARMRH
jgi:hypothetical protein